MKQTQRIGDTVTVPLRMVHMVVRIDQEISHHLSRLRVLNVDMFLLAHGLHKILMHQFPDLPPRLPIIHY